MKKWIFHPPNPVKLTLNFYFCPVLDSSANHNNEIPDKIEVITSVERRRRWNTAEKLEMLEKRSWQSHRYLLWLENMNNGTPGERGILNHGKTTFFWLVPHTD